MNRFMGDAVDLANAGVILKFADIKDPPPAKAFVFVDEHEDSIDDARFLTVSMFGDESQWWLALPASRHNGAGVLSFADGHVETKKWRDPRTRKPVERVRTVGFPSPNNPDVYWLAERGSETTD